MLKNFRRRVRRFVLRTRLAAVNNQIAKSREEMLGELVDGNEAVACGLAHWIDHLHTDRIVLRAKLKALA